MAKSSGGGGAGRGGGAGSASPLERRYEAESRASGVEVGAIILEDGTVLEATGDAAGIRWDSVGAERARGGIVTHTHVDGLPFSENDIVFASRMNLKEIRAVVLLPRGRRAVYSMKAPNGWRDAGGVSGFREFAGQLRGRVADTYMSRGKAAAQKERRSEMERFWSAHAKSAGYVFTKSS